MKKIVYLIIGFMLTLSFSACEDWIDVNENPSKANNTVPTPDLRLRAIQTQFIDAYETSGTRVAWITQNITKVPSNNSNDNIQRWDCPIGSATWPYQCWFVYCASNLQPLIEKATAEEAWHYVGAAQLFHAWGFMMMLDLYGEMPYTEALGPDITPAYDDGKTIYYGCMDMLEKAIENFSKSQPPGATKLIDGDLWNGGDLNKWIKLAYGLKARWLNNLSKKSIYDPDAVLEALSKAPQSVTDDTYMQFINTSSSDRATVVGSRQHENVGATGSRLAKWYTDLLTNTFTGGSGVQDPRATRIIPSGEFYNSATGQKEWRLSEGVDLINSDIRTKNGPVAFEITATRPDEATSHPSGLVRADAAQKSDATFTNRWYTTNATPERQGDSVYISVYSERFDWTTGKGDESNNRYLAYRYNGITETNPNYNSGVINVTSTGSFYIRPEAPAHIVCYHEMCFIKAEVLLRKGDVGGALEAYKNGIRAHMVAMNESLKDYPQVLGKEVISETEISTFLSSAAVAQNAGDLTMAKIMQQKQIALSFKIQNWNDMRRFNYSAPHPQFGVVYPDFGRPYEFDALAQECYPSTDPNNVRYWPRRFQQCSHEVNYNIDNLLASNPEARSRTILSLPVWWDIAE